MDFIVVRSFCSIIYATIVCCILGVSFYGPELSENKYSRTLLIIRTILGVCAFGFQVFSLGRVPIAINMIMFNTAPFWAALLQRIFTNESLNNVQISLMVASFCGVLVIAFSKPMTSAITINLDDDVNLTQRYIVGTVLAFLVSWCYAGVGICTRLN